MKKEKQAHVRTTVLLCPDCCFEVNQVPKRIVELVCPDCGVAFSAWSTKGLVGRLFTSVREIDVEDGEEIGLIDNKPRVEDCQE